MQSWKGVLFGIAIVSTIGCGGSDSHLPPPRVPDDEEEEAAAPVQPPSGGAAPSSPGTTSPSVQAKPKAPDAAVSPASTPVDAQAKRSELNRRQRIVDQLTHIGHGIEAYRVHNDGEPVRCFGPQRISWRVGLLPYLDQDRLFTRYSQSEAWDTPGNQALLPEIPPVFLSATEEVGHTQFVVMSGADTAYPADRLADITDGVENTILVVAINPSKAVPWTSPEDYVFNTTTVEEDFFGENGDCCYVLFGRPTGVRRIPATISKEHLLALITPAGGEGISALDVTRPPTPEPDEELLRYLKEHPPVRVAQRKEAIAQPKDAGEKPAGEQPAVLSSKRLAAPAVLTPSKEPGSGPTPASPAQDGRLPIPDEISQQLARRVLREAHREDYTKAKTDDEKKELADKLLARARSPELDPAARYVALELSRKIAVEIGDIPKALESLELTTQGFHTEGRAEKAEILVSSIGLPLSESDNELVLSEGRKLMEQVLERNEFDLADQFLNVALSAARRTRDTKLIAALTARKKEIADARAGWAEVADYVDLLLQHPTHPEANEIVGTYYCLVKQRWEDGLPLLARAADPRLAELAESELKLPATPAEQVTLADRWWNFAEGETKHKLAVRARAAFWYREALSGLPPGLERIKAESRLAKAESKVRAERATETP